MATLRLTRRALHDLAEIESYSVAHWGRRVANEYLDGIEQALLRLKDEPQLLRPKSNISNHFTFYRVRKHFLVCTQVGECVYVLAMRHGGMDLPGRIAELEPTLLDEAAMLDKTLSKSQGNSE